PPQPSIPPLFPYTTLFRSTLDHTGRHSGVLPPVARGLDQFRSAVAELAATVHGAALAAELVPPMLGADGTRSYLLAFQNPAEARDRKSTRLNSSHVAISYA